MNALRCQDIAGTASPRLEGELGPWQRFWVRAHLAFCGNCRLHHQQLARTVELTRTASEGSLSDASRKALLERFRSPR
jgi:predicted anti-sigma-YlaC factor YlaD